MKFQNRAHFRVVLPVLALAALTSCGGYGGGGGGGGDGNSYTIGGDVTGLTSSGLVLQVNGGQDLAIAADGAFTFADPIDSGAIYRVTVLTQPSSPSQTCTPHHAVGSVPKSNVTDVEINCAAVAGFTVGGIVSELEGSGLVLQNNAGDNLRVTANGEFVFETKVPDGTGYAVTVRKQPSDPAQTCVVGTLSGGDGTGTIDAAAVSNISVVCGAHFAYATNAGDDSISSYALNPVTGTLTAIGTPIATGASPFAIVASPDKKHVYVVNRGSDDVSAYAVDATSGALTEIAGSPFPAGDDPAVAGVRCVRLPSIRRQSWFRRAVGVRGGCRNGRADAAIARDLRHRCRPLSRRCGSRREIHLRGEQRRYQRHFRVCHYVGDGRAFTRGWIAICRRQQSLWPVGYQLP